MYQPWSVVAEYPYTGEPFGLEFDDDSTMAEAEYIARQLLATFRLTGLYLPTGSDTTKEGIYLFTFTVSGIPRCQLEAVVAAVITTVAAA